MKRHPPNPYRRAGLSAARGVTIQHLLERLTAGLNRPPSDAELAGVLAMTVGRVRRHRDALGGRECAASRRDGPPARSAASRRDRGGQPVSAALACTTPAALEAVCARGAAMQAAILPMLRAAADGRIALALVLDATAPLPIGRLKRCGRPAVVLIGADMGADEDPPPERWECLPKLRRWARAGVIHGAAGEPEHYRAAVGAAQLHRRLALVECSSRQAQAWAEALACPRTRFILPRDGVHPILPHRGILQ